VHEREGTIFVDGLVDKIAFKRKMLPVEQMGQVVKLNEKERSISPLFKFPFYIKLCLSNLFRWMTKKPLCTEVQTFKVDGTYFLLMFVYNNDTFVYEMRSMKTLRKRWGYTSKFNRPRVVNKDTIIVYGNYDAYIYHRGRIYYLGMSYCKVVVSTEGGIVMRMIHNKTVIICDLKKRVCQELTLPRDTPAAEIIGFT
jgi:hypothetical protein